MSRSHLRNLSTSPCSSLTHDSGLGFLHPTYLPHQIDFLLRVLHADKFLL